MPSTGPAAPRSVSPQSLARAFEAVPDPRRAASVTYPLHAVLALAVAAIVAHHVSARAVAEWGARQSPALLPALGFSHGRTPCQSTLQRLFAKLDGGALAAVLTAHVAPRAPPPAAGQGVAMDGKARRGRLRFPFGEDASLIHAGGGPPVLALLRDAAVSLLGGHGVHQIASRLRRHSQRPTEAVALVDGPPLARA